MAKIRELLKREVEKKEEGFLGLINQFSAKSSDINSENDIDEVIQIITELRNILKEEIDFLHEKLISQDWGGNMAKLEEKMANLEGDTPVKVVVNKTKKEVESFEGKYSENKKIFDELMLLAEALQMYKPLCGISDRYKNKNIDTPKEIKEACKDLSERLKSSFGIES